jgi:hypothetical protein
MEEYPGNSHKKRETQKPEKFEKVIQGSVIRRKPPLGDRLAETFFRGSASSVWRYVGAEILIPSLKDMVSDAVSNGIEQMLFGEPRSSRRPGRPGSPFSPASKVNYGNYSQTSRRPGARDDRREYSQRARSTHDFDQIILATRVEAQEVLDQMHIILDQYEVITVGDLYDLVEISREFTDETWGWTRLDGAGIRKVRDGYLIQLPRPEVLER